MAQVPYFLRMFRSVHKTLTDLNDPQSLDDFEVEFRRQYSAFSMSEFLTEGHVSENFSLLSLQRTCQFLSNMYSEQAHRARDDTTKQRLCSLTSMLWNPILANMLQVANPKPPRTSQSAPTHKPPPPRPIQNRPPERGVNPRGFTPRDKVLEQLIAVRTRSSGSRLVNKDCQAEECAPCNTMFESAHLTLCSEMQCAQPCTASGWYPHISVTSWKKMKGPHDATRRDSAYRFEWRDQAPPRGVRTMPNPLRQKRVEPQVSEQPTVVPSSTVTSVMEDQPLSPNYPPVTDWNEIFEADLARNNYILDDDDDDDYAPMQKLSLHETQTKSGPVHVRVGSPTPTTSAAVDTAPLTPTFATVTRKRQAPLVATKRRTVTMPQL